MTRSTALWGHIANKLSVWFKLKHTVVCIYVTQCLFLLFYRAFRVNDYKLFKSYLIYSHNVACLFRLKLWSGWSFKFNKGIGWCTFRLHLKKGNNFDFISKTLKALMCFFPWPPLRFLRLSSTPSVYPLSSAPPTLSFRTLDLKGWKSEDQSFSQGHRYRRLTLRQQTGEGHFLSVCQSDRFCSMLFHAWSYMFYCVFGL